MTMTTAAAVATATTAIYRGQHALSTAAVRLDDVDRKAAIDALTRAISALAEAREALSDVD